MESAQQRQAREVMGAHLTLPLTLPLTLTLTLTLSSFPVLRSNMPMTQTLAAIKDLTPKMQAPARDTRARRRGILG